VMWYIKSTVLENPEGSWFYSTLFLGDLYGW